MSILRYLGLEPAEGPRDAEAEETETVRRITRALEALDPARARYIASFAFILSRAANADLEISEEETREMERIVGEWGRLPEPQAILVVQIAKTQNQIFGGTENFLVTRQFNSTAGPDQKEDLLRCLFAVSAADDSISVVEENEIWKIASELGITHTDYVSIRAAFRDKRRVLKNLPV